MVYDPVVKPELGRALMHCNHEFVDVICRNNLLAHSPSPDRYVQGWTKERTLGCVNPTSWLPLAASSRNLGTAIYPSPVEFSYHSCGGAVAISFMVMVYRDGLKGGP